MIRYWSVVVCLAFGSFWSGTRNLAHAADPVVPPQKTSEVGQLAGRLLDLQGQPVPEGHAAVFLCDSATGMPIHRETKQPINPTLRDPQFDKLWVVEADDRNHFEFPDVPVGKYRVVAQSWAGTKGFPGFSVDQNPSPFLTLHGVAEEIEIKPGERCEIDVRPLGDHVLKIVNDPKEAHALLLISLKPTLGDGILGPYGWGREFCRHLIGVTQMEVPYVTIMGLPQDAAVHVGLMNYDNNPGVGAASYAAGQSEGKLRIVATWSNGHKEPPPELVELTNHLEQNPIKLADLVSEPGDEPLGEQDALRALSTLLSQDNDRKVNVTGLGEKRLADVLAAYGYVRIRKHRR